MSASEVVPAWARGRTSDHSGSSDHDAAVDFNQDDTDSTETIGASDAHGTNGTSGTTGTTGTNGTNGARSTRDPRSAASAGDATDPAPSVPSAPAAIAAYESDGTPARVVPFISLPMPALPKSDTGVPFTTSSIAASAAAPAASQTAQTPHASQAPRSLLHAGSGFLGIAADTDTLDHGDVVTPARPARRTLPRLHVNWRRTLAASITVAALEGVAFATAYWYVVPTDTGSLLVETTPAGLEILVDGRSAGRTPFSDSLVPGRHTIELRQGSASRVIPVEISAGVQTMQRVTWSKGLRTGQARVTASVTNAHVTIDGKKLGKAPLTISTLAAGKHMVHVESDSGTVTTPIAVTPGETTELDVPVYPGWVSVLAPVELFIFEGERFLGTTEGEKLLLSPGRHTLSFASESLGYRRTVDVTVTPGATAAVSLPMPKVPVTIEGPAGTDLIVDGEPIGKLPVAGLTVPLGTRDFLFKHPDFGERRQVITATLLAPVRVVVR